jgi:hypothetical protein
LADAQNFDPAANVRNRRSRSEAVQEIATHIVVMCGIDPNPHILEVVTKTLDVVQRNKHCTLEAAVNAVGGRAAALITAETQPNDWLEWFADARYEYVSKEDSKLKDRSVEARPVCGGTQCQDGWEKIRVNGHDIVRRCAQCVQLWQDRGYV